MSGINKKSTIEEIAAIVSQALTDAEISAVLSGGASVSIYSHNEYESKDLDFVSSEQMKKIAAVLTRLGFEKTKTRYFAHPQTEYFVEFPPGPLAVGDEVIKDWERRKTPNGVIQMLTPTQCVMDRLAGYVHWKDPQSLEQAVLVATHQKDGVNLDKVKKWCKSEGAEDEYLHFMDSLKKKSTSAK